MALSVPAEVKRTTKMTVAVATLDRPKDLACCLKAILSGDCLPGELIVVDQSAEQNAKPVIERFRGVPCPVHYIYQQKCGLSASRNAAIEKAIYPWIAFTDDDCIPDQTWAASLEQAFNTFPHPAAVSGQVLPYGQDAPELYSVSSRESKVRADFIGKKIPWDVGTGGNFAIQREWLDRVGMFDERLGAGAPGKAAEDADMIFRLLRSGGRIRYEPDALIFHQRQNVNRRMRSRWNYGFGIGAFCALWLRKLDLYSAYILVTWLRNISGEMLGAALKGQWQETKQRALSLSGTWNGFVFGLWEKPVKRSVSG